MNADLKIPNPLACELQCWSNSERLGQLFAGLGDLHRAGRIRLKQTFLPPPALDWEKPQHLRGAFYDHATVLVGSKRLFFDMHDSHEIDLAQLSACDLYFKRSLRKGESRDEEQSKKVRAWGLNYPVESDAFDRFALFRHWRFNRGVNKLRECWRHLPGARHRSLSVSRFEGLPEDAPPRALLMTRLWDPEDDPTRSKEKKAHFVQINEERVNCVRRLRAVLGDRFYGGVANTELARRCYPDAIVPESGATSKWRYLERVRKHPICITTSGLHGSTGWRMGEYVAMSRAIISEELENEVPGGFHSPTHYLAFTQIAECEDLVVRLFEDAALRRGMMEACHQHYLEQGRPDRIVWNALCQVVGQSPKPLKNSVL